MDCSHQKWQTGHRDICSSISEAYIVDTGLGFPGRENLRPHVS